MQKVGDESFINASGVSADGHPDKWGVGAVIGYIGMDQFLAKGKAAS